MRGSTAISTTSGSLTRDNPASRGARPCCARCWRSVSASSTPGSRQLAADAATAGLISLLDQGKAMMDETRAVIGMGMGEERHLFDQRIEARRAAERYEILSAVLVTIIAIIVLLMAAVLAGAQQCAAGDQRGDARAQARFCRPRSTTSATALSCSTTRTSSPLSTKSFSA